MSGVKVMVEIDKALLDACLAEGRCQWCRTPTDRFVSSQAGSNYFCARCKGPEGGDVTFLRSRDALMDLGEAVLIAAGYR
jgi:hypothetical protein